VYNVANFYTLFTLHFIFTLMLEGICYVLLFCCQTNDPVISTENDEQLMLKADLSLLENGVG